VTRAERLLQELGVTEPEEIDLEAIAFYLGARVRYWPLDGCEACIIGNADAAIINVNSQSSGRRKRFSIAHELGHWCHHRGRSLVCRVDDYRPRDTLSPERVADAYAADLLMPRYLLDAAVREYPKLTLKAVMALADLFATSSTATAIRVVEGNYFPALVVSHGINGRKWFARAAMVPDRWFPKAELDADSFAFDVLHAGKPADAHPRKIGADAWFDRWNAGTYDIYEQTMRISAEEVLTLLLISDQRMLEDEESHSYRR
jgi:IrrE N-terminal-like domain